MATALETAEALLAPLAADTGNYIDQSIKQTNALTAIGLILLAEAKYRRDMI